MLSVALVLLSACVIATPSLAQVAVGVSVSFAPPDLPVYEQPLCPGEDYIWTPGYWDWDGDDYYWVPGTWVLAPEPGFFWTPGYWAWGDSGFIFTAGYWGPVVGFYGGINYGYGYFGRGYEGGRWDRGHFFYNREVNNVNVNIVHNTYNTTVVNKTVNVTRISYNGGNGGVNVRPTPQEQAAIHERHIPPVPAQAQHIQQARSNPQLRAMTNQGRPPIAATMKPADFKGNGIVPAREGGALHHNIARPGNGNSSTAGRPENNNVARPNPSHARDIPAADRPPAPNTGNAKLDQKYQQQQQKLAEQQTRDQQKLQQRQDQEHQKLEKQQADEAKRQQVEQRHQQQTQQLIQKHTDQNQRMQQKQQPHPAPPPPPPSHAPKKPAS
jgi:hypothetical protein